MQFFGPFKDERSQQLHLQQTYYLKDKMSGKPNTFLSAWQHLQFEKQERLLMNNPPNICSLC